jgi:sugar phosphate isomerase/epimerase
MEMKLGCGEWGFRELPMEEHFEICKKFGFSTMEIGIGGGVPGRLPEKMTQEDIDSFIALRDRYGIKTPFCCLENDFTLPTPEAHEENLEICLEQMRTAAQLGCTHIRLFAGFTPFADMTDEIWQRLFEAFEKAEALATSLGMVISIETHGKIDVIDDTAVHTHTVTTHRDGLKRLLEGLPKKVGFNYDPGNIKAADPEDKRYALDLLNARINYCHLKDWTYKGPGFIAGAPGDDDLDYADLLPQMEFDGIFLIEYEPTEDLVDGISRSIQYLQSVGELAL